MNLSQFNFHLNYYKSSNVLRDHLTLALKYVLVVFVIVDLPHDA